MLDKVLGSGAKGGSLGLDASAIAESAFKTIMATVGDAAAAVGAAVSLGLGLWDMVKGAQALAKASNVVDGELSRLIGSTTEWIDRPDPSFVW